MLKKMLESGVYKRGELDIPKVIGEILSKGLKNVGSLMSFIGVVRENGKDGKKVSRVDMEAYEQPASITIGKISKEIKEKYHLSLVRMYHFVGSFEIGEPLVFIVIGGQSRKDTFPALQEAVERYKTEPYVFKREVYNNGTHAWISDERDDSKIK